MDDLENVDTGTVIAIPLTALEAARAEVIRLENEIKEATTLASKARLESLLNTMTTLGFDDATIGRVLAAVPLPVSNIARIRRNGQPVQPLMRKDGTVNTYVNPDTDGGRILALANGEHTLAEIAEMMGVRPRAGDAYTAGYVRSWLTSGGHGKKMYFVTYDNQGRVTAHPPVAASA